LGRTWGVTVVAIQRGQTDLIFSEPQQKIQPGDQLFVIGREEKVAPLHTFGLEISFLRS
jgi:K+/H+ antiporter YhaU regulatory subunit KhtT